MSDQETREALAAFIDGALDGDAGTNVGPGLADAILSRFAVTPKDETEWEYGWRCFFDNGEEHEWLACASRDEAEYQAAEYQIEEDATHPAGAGHLTYSVWRRRTAKAGPWEPVPAGEGSD